MSTSFTGKPSKKQQIMADKNLPNIGEVVIINSIEATSKTIQLTSRHSALRNFRVVANVDAHDGPNIVFLSWVDHAGRKLSDRVHLNDIELTGLKRGDNGYWDILSKISNETKDKAYEMAEEIVNSVSSLFESPKSTVLSKQLGDKEDYLVLSHPPLSSGCKVDTDKFIEYKSFHGSEVSNALKNEIDNGDYVVYIPVDWADYAGFTEEDVKLWISMINEMNFEVLLTYEGHSIIPKFTPNPHKDYIANLLYGGNLVFDNYPKWIKTQKDFIVNNKAYKVILTGCESGMVNYMVFSLLTSLFKGRSSDFVAAALQIKEALGVKITPLQALMMASVIDNSSFFRLREPGKEVALEYIPDIFESNNSVHMVCRRLHNKPKKEIMSKDLFIYKEVTSDLIYEMMVLIYKRDFETLYDKFKIINNES